MLAKIVTQVIINSIARKNHYISMTITITMLKKGKEFFSIRQRLESGPQKRQAKMPRYNVDWRF